MKTIEAYCRNYIWTGSNELTRKALVAWSRMCMPKTAGGLNLTNLKVWNKAAIAKTCWELHGKKDILWIKWIHEYYIKGKQITDMAIPQQASWMVKKIFKAQEDMGNAKHQISGNKNKIRSIYLSMIGQLPKVTWKNLMCGNIARPKAIFNTWLQLQDRLFTVIRLQSWGLQIDTAWHMCKQAEETEEPLFAECEVSNRIWSKLMRWIQIDWPAVKTGGEMQKWIEQRTKGKTKQAKIVKMIYTEFIYSIWIERNTRVFMKKEKASDTIAREIAYICHVRADEDLQRLLNIRFPIS
ncbi:PREDICTED: uncharacterized protein LOC109208613 [Nicotiana attenuata]|uniref:uncharacterized protein LOC109208613 n=1 Tax=Nicotiana attenuata TaxID=49451 RepID=UPI00090525BE|nr:PREDICTED: uncharacterized protein LOC109208613 [Nicotiana attenuata]